MHREKSSDFNEKLKKKLERDINIELANLNRNTCSFLPVAFAMDSLDKVHILPKYVLIEPVDYELIRHYFMRSIQFNHESLRIKRNWAHCLDLAICPEKMLPYPPSEDQHAAPCGQPPTRTASKGLMPEME